MHDPDKLRSHAGRILFGELPEEYRYRDQREDDEAGDLEAFLHGFGHMLDLIRETTGQAYADAFAEEVDGRALQPWLIPYLADLLGAQLVSPDPTQRIAELNHSVGWYKSKGTFSTVDEVADVVAGTETVSREGWRHVLTTPRMSLPPFSTPPVSGETEAMTASMYPQGCPDFRRMSRAVQDPDGANPLFRIKPRAGEAEERAIYWRHHNPGGLPCFPGAYDDGTLRTPDLRTPDGSARVGPHPRRTLIHVRPPAGIFRKGTPEVELRSAVAMTRAFGFEEGKTAVISAEDIAERFDRPPTDTIRVKLKSSLKIPAGDFTFRGILFSGLPGKPVKIQAEAGARLTFENSAVEDLSIDGPQEATGPQLIARNSVFDIITAPEIFAEFEYVTVMTSADLGRLNASDCILADLGDTLNCEDGEGPPNCLRYTAVGFAPGNEAARNCFDLASPTNTRRQPAFIRLWRETEEGCTFGPAPYGEPGYAVLDLTTPEAILSGAEDDGEQGVHHGDHHAAAIRALSRKLEAFLPLGQEIAIFYDPMLALTPPVLARADT